MEETCDEYSSPFHRREKERSGLPSQRNFSSSVGNSYLDEIFSRRFQRRYLSLRRNLLQVESESKGVMPVLIIGWSIYNKLPKDEQKEFLGIANSETDRLTRLVNDVLDLSRLESSREVQFESLDLRPAIEQTMRNYKLNAEEKDVVDLRKLGPHHII